MKKAEEANSYYDKKPEKMNVYDASEGVKNMPVKTQYEEHKKISPQEFGAKVANVIDPALLAPLAGAALGAGAGALSSRKNRFRNALIGAGMGGAAGGAAEFLAPGAGLMGKYQVQDLMAKLTGAPAGIGKEVGRMNEMLAHGRNHPAIDQEKGQLKPWAFDIGQANYLQPKKK